MNSIFQSPPPADGLFVLSTLGVGGSETKVVNLVNGLAEANCKTGLAYLNPPENLIGRVRNEVIVRHLERRGKYSVRSLFKLRNLMDQGFRTVISVNLYPLVYIVPAARLLNRSCFKLVCLVNTTDFPAGGVDWGRVYSPFLRQCDEVIFGCEAQKEMWHRRYNLAGPRSGVIYNGIDCNVFSQAADFQSARSFRSELGIPEDATVVGSVGRLDLEKNYQSLVEAVIRLKSSGRDTFLLLVGDGPNKAALQSAMATAGMQDRLVLPGILADVRPALAAMDIFVLPSRAVETFSNAALQALAMSVPVVMSRVGGAAEMVQDELNGYLFDADDVNTLTKILSDLCDSGARREEIGLAGRERVRKQFTFENMLREFRELIG